MSMERLRILVEGRVQGVWFRGSTQEQAQRLGLTGYAKNLPDRSVEIVAEGNRQDLEALLSWAAHGPTGARVDTLQHWYEAADGGFTAFETC